jgi:hypothetical protein
MRILIELQSPRRIASFFFRGIAVRLKSAKPEQPFRLLRPTFSRTDFR